MAHRTYARFKSFPLGDVMGFDTPMKCRCLMHKLYLLNVIDVQCVLCAIPVTTQQSYAAWFKFLKLKQPRDLMASASRTWIQHEMEGISSPGLSGFFTGTEPKLQGPGVLQLYVGLGHS